MSAQVQNVPVSAINAKVHIGTVARTNAHPEANPCKKLDVRNVPVYDIGAKGDKGRIIDVAENAEQSNLTHETDKGEP